MTRRDLLQAGIAMGGWKMLPALRASAGEDPAWPPPDPIWRKVFQNETCGLNYYSQGGIVVDGTAYFTANDYSCRQGFRGTDTSGLRLHAPPAGNNLGRFTPQSFWRSAASAASAVKMHWPRRPR